MRGGVQESRRASIAGFAGGSVTARSAPTTAPSTTVAPVGAPLSEREAATDVAAVILAAGEGLRLGRLSKPLAPVAGITLLERTIATVRAAGVGRVIVVVGHAKEAVAEFLEQRALDVELVENERFSVGNGSSAVAGGTVAGERFLLMMCDHLVEPAVIGRMIACRAPFAVAVDREPMFCEVDEATKVQVAGGAVITVARELEQWDAVDAGIFVCDRSVLDAAERALAAGEGTWNAVKRQWIAEGRRLDVVDVTGAFWIDVDTPADARRAERLIVDRAARKPTDGVVSRHLNRPVSRRVSLRLVRRGVSPTAATLGTFGLALVGALLVALGARWAVALTAGGFFVQLASIVDGCDGEVARATLRSSRFGALLDTLLDRTTDVALVVALAVAAGFATATWVALVIALVATLLVPYVKAAYEARARAPFPAVGVWFGRDARLLTIAIAAVVQRPLAGLLAVAAVSSAEAAWRAVVALRASARAV